MKATLRLKPGDELTIFSNGVALVSETLDRGKVVKLKIAKAPAGEVREE